MYPCTQHNSKPFVNLSFFEIQRLLKELQDAPKIQRLFSILWTKCFISLMHNIAFFYQYLVMCFFPCTT